MTVGATEVKDEVLKSGWFLLEGEEKVLLVPVKGCDKDWFNKPIEDPQIELAAGGVATSSKATIVRDPKKVEKVLDKFRGKYRSMWSES